MRLIFCIDKKNGMMLFGKRQSQDSVLRERLLEMVGDSKLYMSDYTAKQFEPHDNIIIDNNYVNNAGPDDYVFVENLGYASDKIDEVILCKWNRQYQADVFFDIDMKVYKKSSSENIKGSSHDKITIERYVRG